MVKRRGGLKTEKAVALFTSLCLQKYPWSLPIPPNQAYFILSKFHLCQSNSCQKIFQNIVTWGVELRLWNALFACFLMESLFSGVRSWCAVYKWPPFCTYFLSVLLLKTLAASNLLTGVVPVVMASTSMPSSLPTDALSGAYMLNHCCTDKWECYG